MRLIAVFIYGTFRSPPLVHSVRRDHFHAKFLSPRPNFFFQQTSSSVKITQLWRQIVECWNRKHAKFYRKHAAARSTFYQSPDDIMSSCIFATLKIGLEEEHLNNEQFIRNKIDYVCTCPRTIYIRVGGQTSVQSDLVYLMENSETNFFLGRPVSLTELKSGLPPEI